MKLSMETYDLFRRFGERKTLALIKEAGFDCIDYSFYWLTEAMQKEILGDGYVAHAQDTRAYMDSIGLACNQAHAHFDFDVNKDTLDTENKHYRDIVRSLEIAAVLGAEHIVLHALPAKEDETLLDTNYRFYKSFEPYLQQLGIKIAIENLYGDRGTVSFLQELMAKLDSDCYVFCIDVGHAAMAGYEPQDFIREIGGARLRGLHVQDTEPGQDRHWLPYVGKIKWTEVTKSLQEVGYTGDITLEIFCFTLRFENELLPQVLQLAASTGRHLINKCH